jgi:hypothetical protein
MWKIFIVYIFIIAMIGKSRTFVLLYNTESGYGNEEINCIYYLEQSTVKYCIRLGANTYVSRNMNVCLNGQKWHFSQLLIEEISPWEILSWSSSVEKVDDYARVFYNHSKNFEDEPFLCNCTPGFFGKNCEYQLLFDASSFSKALQIPFRAHQNPEGHQKWGKILCYETLICDYGKLCLDWRNICDGQQNCMDGIDEENCDLLEFNECNDDEYRCIDGMCIAEEYWIDGKVNDR